MKETKISQSPARRRWRWAALAIAAFAALGAAAPAPGAYVTRSGAGFVRDGEPYRFVGVNARSLLWDANEWSHVDEYLAAAHAMGVKVIRIYLARTEDNWDVHRNLSEATARLTELFQKVENAGYDLKFLLCLTDNIRDEWLNHVVPGDKEYYGDDRNLRREWFESGYRENYLEFVRGLQGAFYDHEAIFAWQLGNEFQVRDSEALDGGASNLDTLLAFAYHVGNQLRHGDPAAGLPPVRQMITPGLISVRHAIYGEEAPGGQDQARHKLHVQWCSGGQCQPSPFDFMAIHTYDNRHSVPVGQLACDVAPCPHDPNGEYDDLRWNRAQGTIPLVVDEASFSVGLRDTGVFPGGWWSLDRRGARLCPTPNTTIGRSPAMRRTLASFFDLAGADGVMHWLFLPGATTYLTDPWTLGFLDHKDFDLLTQVYRTQAVRLERGASLGEPARWNGLSGPFCVELVGTETEIVMVGSPGPPVLHNVALQSLSDVATVLLVSEDVPWLSVSSTQGTIGAGQLFDLLLVGQCSHTTPGSHETVVDVRLRHPTNGQEALERLFVRLECPEAPPESCVTGRLYYNLENPCHQGWVHGIMPLDLLDPVTQEWRHVADLPLEDGHFCANLLRNRLYRMRRDDCPSSTWVCTTWIELDDPGAHGFCGGSGCQQLGAVEFYCGS